MSANKRINIRSNVVYRIIDVSIGLCLLTLLIHLSDALINFGKIRMLYIILKHKSTELEVAVKVCVIQ